MAKNASVHMGPLAGTLLCSDWRYPILVFRLWLLENKIVFCLSIMTVMRAMSLSLIALTRASIHRAPIGTALNANWPQEGSARLTPMTAFVVTQRACLPHLRKSVCRQGTSRDSATQGCVCLTYVLLVKILSFAVVRNCIPAQPSAKGSTRPNCVTIGSNCLLQIISLH